MRLLGRWRVVPLVAVLVAGAASPVLAQGDRNAEARVYFEQGNRHLTRAMRARGQRREALLQQALDSYVESLNIVRSRNVLFNAAFALGELGRADEAFAYYTEYVGMPGISDEERAEAQRRIDDLRPRVAIIAVGSDPSGAEVRVDRRDLLPRGRTPLEIAVPAGEHRIFLAHEGYRPAELTAAAVVGQRASVQGTLEPEPVPVTIRAPAWGQLTIDGNPVRPGEQIDVDPGRHTIRFEPAFERVIEIQPGAEPQLIDLDVPDAPRGRGALAFAANTRVRVTVDGVVVGEGDQVSANVPSGRHAVEITAPGHAPTRSEVDLQPGETLALDVHMEPSVAGESTLGDWPLIAWLGTGVFGLGAAALSINALVANQDFEDAATTMPRPRQEDLEDQFHAVEQANLIADVFWAGTAVVGLTAIVLTLLDRPERQPPSLIQVGAAPLAGGALVMAELPWGTP